MDKFIGYIVKHEPKKINEKSCYNECKFYDGRNDCCMYKCATLCILHQRENCENYSQGRFNYEELEKTNFQ